jgi:hypothetical protein
MEKSVSLGNTAEDSHAAIGKDLGLDNFNVLKPAVTALDDVQSRRYGSKLRADEFRAIPSVLAVIVHSKYR